MDEKVDRRTFLKTAASGAAGTLVASSGALSRQPAPPKSAVAPVLPKEVDPQSSSPDVLTTNRPGSDFMVDVVKSLDFEYLSANPGSSFRGLQESIINYGANRSPEFLTCCHEESAVGMAHGYAKIEGKPIMSMVHGTVGTQHASMAIYNAFCDRVPAIVILGNETDATARRSFVEWTHAAQDAAVIIRDFTKWDDAPGSLQHFAESFVRAYKMP